MAETTYRLKSPTLVLLPFDQGLRIPVTIPQDDTVVVADLDINGNRLIDVTWEGNTVMMFTADLRDRGERVGTDDLP